MTLVSVVIPVYNRRHLALPSIRSALAQTYPDVEVVVVDDGSTDGTADALADAFGAQIRLMRLPQNVGRSAARNAGWNAARGSLIAFLDSDDLWEPTKLARQVPYFDAPDVSLVHCRVGLIDADGHGLAAASSDVLRAFKVAEARGYDYGGITETWCRMYTPAVVVRREALVATGGFDPALDHFEDWDLFWRLAAQGRVVTVPEVLAQVRTHSGNSRTSWREDAVPWLTVCQKHLSALPASLATAAQHRAHRNLLINSALGEYWRGDLAASRQWMWRAVRADPTLLLRPWHVVWGAPLLHALLPNVVATVLIAICRADPYRAKPWDAKAPGTV